MIRASKVRDFNLRKKQSFIGKRLLVFFLGLVCSALFAEGVLFSAGMISGRLRNDANDFRRKLSADPNIIRIVTIGESTTAPTFNREGRQVDWPFQFEPMLNDELQARNEPHRVQVFNIARSGTSSTFQWTALLEVASEMRPDIIISMLGVNSSAVELVERNFLYRNSFLVRFIYWSQIAWNCPRCYEIKSFVPHASERMTEGTGLEQAAQAMGVQLFDNSLIASENDLASFAAKLQDLQKEYRLSASLMNVTLANKLFIASRSVKIRDVKPELEAKLLAAAENLYFASYDDLIARFHPFVRHFCDLQTRQKKLKVCLEAIKLAIAKGAEVTPELLTVAARSGAVGDPVLKEIFLNVGYRTGTEKWSGRVLGDIYRRLGDFVNETGSAWFAMQYPTGSVEGLKYFLSNVPGKNEYFYTVFYTPNAYPLDARYRNVFFVSNENFNTLVSPDNEVEYFLDYFARESGLNFGHTTQKGHAVIARNLSDEMIKNWTAVKDVVARRRKNGF